MFLTIIGLILTFFFGLGKMFDGWCLDWSWFGVFAPLIIGGILDLMGRAVFDDDWFTWIVLDDILENVFDNLDSSDFGGHDD